MWYSAREMSGNSRVVFSQISLHCRMHPPFVMQKLPSHNFLLLPRWRVGRGLLL